MGSKYPGYYVYTPPDGVTELRVHGVSGTPPEAMLQQSAVKLVSGDTTAGFYRPVWEAEPKPDPAGARPAPLEAYCWGGLTSGSWKRALWLLLLPFMLVNVAHFMTPRSRLLDEPKGDTKDQPAAARRWRLLRDFNEAAQRLLALTLTVTFVLAINAVTMDLMGWQCARRGTQCSLSGWASFLSGSWLSGPGTRLAVTALIPLAVVALLWSLGHQTWMVTEATKVKSEEPQDQENWVSELEDRRFWNGEHPVARLRAAHVVAGFSCVGLFLSVPLMSANAVTVSALWSSSQWTRPWGWLPTLLTWLFLLILAASAVAVLFPSISSREVPKSAASTSGTAQTPGTTQASEGAPAPSRFRAAAPWVAVGLVALAWIFAVTNGFGGDRLSATRGRSTLPWLDGMILWQFYLQALLMALLFVACLIQAHVGNPAGSQETEKPAWFGLAQPVVAGMGWLLLSGVAAAVTLRVSHLLGTPVATETLTGARRGVATAGTLLVPAHIFWASVVAAILVLALLVAMIIALVPVILGRRGGKDARNTELAEQVENTYDVQAKTSPAVQARIQEIATIWRRAGVGDSALSGMAGYAIFAGAVIVIAGIWSGLAPSWLVTQASGNAPELIRGGLVTLGSWLAIGAVFVLIYVGRQAYSSPTFRRTIGMVWDIGAFWPRASHPLAPPCYAERTVPNLSLRIDYLTGTEPEGDPVGAGRVLFSCHSQGTIIGAATVASLSRPAAGAVMLLTYGCPLTRLYARFFPTYFNTRCRERVGELLTAQSKPPVSRWPWINLYRPSDPIGSYVFSNKKPTADTAADVDKQSDNGSRSPGEAVNSPASAVDRYIADPQFAKPQGDPCYPLALGHSDYWVDPAFLAAIEDLEKTRHATSTVSDFQATWGLAN